MRAAAVICEYNPFHFGHLKQLEALKGEYDAVIGVMSGDAVQRGEAAIADKYVRARAAVENGLDAVFSLPFPHCCASASDFARAGVYVAASLGADALAFGVEDDFARVERAFAVVGAPGFSDALDALIRREKTLSYPKAVGRLAGAETAALLQKPNNILAVEYLRALRELRAPLRAAPVPRDGTLASSSSLRALLFDSGRDAFLRALPEGSRRVYGALDGAAFPRDTERLSRALLLLLRGGRADLSGLYGTGGGLGERMVRAAAEADSLSALVARCRSAGFTASAAQRARRPQPPSGSRRGPRRCWRSRPRSRSAGIPAAGRRSSAARVRPAGRSKSTISEGAPPAGPAIAGPAGGLPRPFETV